MYADPVELTEQDKAKNIFVDMVFGPDILDGILKLHGKDGWNHWVEKARRFYGATSFPAKNEECEPFCMELNFDGHDFSGRDLSGLQLGCTTICHAILKECNLSHSELGMIAWSDLRGSDLTGATIAGLIDGADFTGCNMKDVQFKDAWLLDDEVPPIGLPQEMLALCMRPVLPEEKAGDESAEGGNTVPIEVISATLVSFWNDFRGPASQGANEADLDFE